MKIKFYPKELFFVFLAVLLPVSLVLENVYGVPFIGYSDEVICLICLPIMFTMIFNRQLDQKDWSIIILLGVLTALTLLGNIVSKVVTNWFPIVVDMICLLKVFATFIVYKHLAYMDKSRTMLDYLVPVAKLLIISGAIFGFISIFADIGMTYGERRYGIKPYNFIFGASGGGSRYGYMVACMLLILLISNISKLQSIFYHALAVFSMILITKGVVYIVLAIYFVLLILWRNKKRVRFSVVHIVLIALASIGVSTYQINAYIADMNSPRMTIIRYGIRTANSYFPLGAGFASYGSDMASKYYSPLYIRYGFMNMWGLSKTHGFFLNDGYLSLIFGEMGYIGLVLFIAIIVLITMSIYKMKNCTNMIKALTMSIFLGLVATIIGTAIIKSSGGVFVMVMLGLVMGYCQQSEEERLPSRYKKRQINIKF